MIKRILSILIIVIISFSLGGTREVQAASCAGVTPGNVTVRDGSGARYVVYGVTGASYVFVQSRPNGGNYMATHLSGGDWEVSVNADGVGTFEVAFYPGGEYCASATFTRTAPPPPVQYYSCYGGGPCHPDDNSGTFPNDNTCGGNQACYVAPPTPPTGTVNITSTNQSAANYTTFPDGNRYGWNGSHTWSSAPIGTYYLAADDVTGYTKSISPPSPQTLSGNGTINWSISYTAIPTVTATMTCPASPITYNTSTNVLWSSSNASSCTGAPSGGTGPSGTFNTGNLTSQQSYSVTCNR